MKITFGLDLDGYQDLQPRDRFNESICGPQGFLSLLELRLGLASKPASAAGRIVQYREFLQKAASIRERFYTASFAKDPLAVAETLLRWRDELVLAGWDGSPGPSGQPTEFATWPTWKGWLGPIYHPVLAIEFGKRWLNSIDVILSLPPSKCSKFEIASLYCCEGYSQN